MLTISLTTSMPMATAVQNLRQTPTSACFRSDVVMFLVSACLHATSSTNDCADVLRPRLQQPSAIGILALVVRVMTSSAAWLIWPCRTSHPILYWSNSRIPVDGIMFLLRGNTLHTSPLYHDQEWSRKKYTVTLPR